MAFPSEHEKLRVLPCYKKESCSLCDSPTDLDIVKTGLKQAW